MFDVHSLNMTKDEKYRDILKTIDSLVKDEDDIITVMSTIAFVVKSSFDNLNWVGFYRLVDEKTLKVGPYQGGLGCLKIDISRGVCGKCVTDKKMQMHNDITKVEYHIACDSETKAEIVFPVADKEGNVRAVLDIDSLTLNCFDETDVNYLQKITDIVSNKYNKN